jgi:hypothetical protein
MIVHYGITDIIHRLEQFVTIRIYTHVSIINVNTRL